MPHQLIVGMEYTLERVVSDKNTADYYGSGDVTVFATPCMILQMEQAAMLAVQPFLSEGFTTVGTLVNTTHCAATPIGMKVRTKAVLVEIDRRRLVYDIEAYDELELIGKCKHERFIVERESFVEKCNSKIVKK